MVIASEFVFQMNSYRILLKLNWNILYIEDIPNLINYPQVNRSALNYAQTLYRTIFVFEMKKDQPTRATLQSEQHWPFVVPERSLFIPYIGRMFTRRVPTLLRRDKGVPAVPYPRQWHAYNHNAQWTLSLQCIGHSVWRLMPDTGSFVKRYKINRRWKY